MPARKDRRARSRKRRAQAARPAGDGGSPGVSAQAKPDKFHAAVADAKAGRRQRPAPSAKPGPERPRPPWHPLPLAELLIVAGTVAFVIGMRRGKATLAVNAQRPLFVGIAAVALGTLEFTLREHRSGFRSHTTLLAVLPVVVFHTVVVLVISLFTHVGQTINLIIVAFDVVLFAVAFRALRAGYLQARHDQLTRARPRG